MSQCTAFFVAVPLLAATVGCRPAPVTTFEDFYAATVANDAAAVRALLCAEGRSALAAIDDATLLRAMSVAKVVRRAALDPAPPRPDGSVDVLVTDALDQTVRVTLRPDPAAPRGWCVLGETP